MKPSRIMQMKDECCERAFVLALSSWKFLSLRHLKLAAPRRNSFSYSFPINSHFFYINILSWISGSYSKNKFLTIANTSTPKWWKYFFLFLKLIIYFGLWHVEVPGPGIKPTPQQQPELLQWQCWILNPLHWAGDWTGATTETSWFINPLHQSRNSWKYFFLFLIYLSCIHNGKMTQSKKS